MILADKIISLRKQAGWSQEELAQQLGVTRQSVSKWEGAQSIPDMDKILQLSRLFGVSTDYLLKDELEESQPTGEAAEEPHLRQVTMEQAAQYLALRKAAAPKMALATFLCVLSPIPLIALSAFSELGRLSENAAACIGMCALVLMVTAAVMIFMSCGAKAKDFAFLEKEPFETAYGVSGMVRQRLKEFEDRYTRLNGIATALCILSVLPLFAVMCFQLPDLAYIGAVCALLLVSGIACICFVYGGTYHNAMKKLLEEDEYTRESKAKKGWLGAVTVCYWLVVTAVFLLYTFGPWGNGNPQYSWIVWAVGGVLYGGLAAVLAVVRRR